jgi:glutamine amidotransferase
MIAIIDYGLGNVKAFAHVYKNLNIPFIIAQKPDDLLNAAKIILPGVGAFDHAMERLNASGMHELLDDMVLRKNMPVLGVCVGMQMLANFSEEGKLPGLKWIDGEVKKFISPAVNDSFYIPHMGWNNISPIHGNKLLNGLDENSRFYFLHSYYFHCSSPETSLAVTNYGIRFSCVVNKKNIYGVQFHPEKSHQWGIQLLKNFAEL